MAGFWALGPNYFNIAIPFLIWSTALPGRNIEYVLSKERNNMHKKSMAMHPKKGNNSPVGVEKSEAEDTG